MNQQAMMRLKKMQKEMMQKQNELMETVFTGTAGGGMVSVDVKGDHSVVSIKVDPDAFESKDDIEMICDSIVAAINDANNKIDQKTSDIMGPFAGGMPGLF